MMRLLSVLLLVLGAPALAQQQTPRCAKKRWPSLELLLPLHFPDDTDTTNKRLHEWNNYFMTSLLFFWPLRESGTRLTFIVDEEKKSSAHVKDFDMKIVKNDSIARHFANSGPRLVFDGNNDASVWSNRGHDRQQYMQFMAEKYLSTTPTPPEFVGFVDTDTYFIAYVDRDDLFEGNGTKPVINVRIGLPQNSWWKEVPPSNKWLVGKDSGMRCMSYFPVILKTAHLKEMREYFQKLHGKKTFEDVFRHYSGSYQISQFGAMCEWLWHFRRDSYSWYFHDTDPDFDFNLKTEKHENIMATTCRGIEGTAECYQRIGPDFFKHHLKPEMFLPKPRIAIHARYHKTPSQESGVTKSPAELANEHSASILRGFCLASPPFPKVGIAKCMCQGMATASQTVLDLMHRFEGAHFLTVKGGPNFTIQSQLRAAEAMHAHRLDDISGCQPTHYDWSLFDATSKAAKKCEKAAV